jgi:putative transposase
MVSSQAGRDQVALAMERGHSQRQACELMELPRSILNYRSLRAERDAPTLDAMRRIAATYPRYGYRRVRICAGRVTRWDRSARIDSGASPDCNYRGVGRGDG